MGKGKSHKCSSFKYHADPLWSCIVSSYEILSRVVNFDCLSRYASPLFWGNSKAHACTWGNTARRKLYDGYIVKPTNRTAFYWLGEMESFIRSTEYGAQNKVCPETKHGPAASIIRIRWLLRAPWCPLSAAQRGQHVKLLTGPVYDRENFRSWPSGSCSDIRSCHRVANAWSCRPRRPKNETFIKTPATADYAPNSH